MNGLVNVSIGSGWGRPKPKSDQGDAGQAQTKSEFFFLFFFGKITELNYKLRTLLKPDILNLPIIGVGQGKSLLKTLPIVISSP